MAEVRLARRAVKDLDALGDRTARRVADALEAIGRDPAFTGLDVKPLVGRRPWRRLRVGNFRILFRVADGGRTILVARVIDRKDLVKATATLPE